MAAGRQGRLSLNEPLMAEGAGPDDTALVQLDKGGMARCCVRWWRVIVPLMFFIGLLIGAGTVFGVLSQRSYSPAPATNVTLGGCANRTDVLTLLTQAQTFQPACSACARGCTTDACAISCIVTATSLSVPCATCFARQIDCVKANCLIPCLLDPTSPNCVDCKKQYCRPALLTCVNIPEFLLIAPGS
jgi:hypothetical protein